MYKTERNINMNNVKNENLSKKAILELLRSKSPEFEEPIGSEDIENNERSEEMTLKEVLRLKEALKKDGYTEEQIDKLLYYIANEQQEYPGKD